jgi:uncharacterized protein (DUF2062 family)
MLRKFFKRHLPDVDKVRELKAFALFGDTLLHPALWHLNRRTAAGGVAAGLFCGLIPGPLQMLGAAIAAVVFRFNLPLALVTTLYTNPLTIVPLYLVAYKYGAFALGAAAGRETPLPPDWSWAHPLESAHTLGQWALDLGAPLGTGLVLLAATLSMAGYIGVRVLWSIHLRRAWQARKLRRHQRDAAGSA